jgi:hypothetical protein
MREIVLTPRRAAIAALLGGAAAALLRRPALGQGAPAPSVHLFRVVGPRGTVTVGVTAAELASWGSGEPVSVLAERLVAAGQATVWAYAVGRAADGSLAMVPRGRTALLRSDTLRIEPYAPAQPVIAP